MKKNCLNLVSALGAIVTLAAIASPVCRAETGANIGIDGRGLLHVGDILKDGPKANYGFVNFVAFGPGESAIRERVGSLVDVTPSVLAAFDGEV